MNNSVNASAGIFPPFSIFGEEVRRGNNGLNPVQNRKLILFSITNYCSNLNAAFTQSSQHLTPNKSSPASQ